MDTSTVLINRHLEYKIFIDLGLYCLCRMQLNTTERQYVACKWAAVAHLLWRDCYAYILWEHHKKGGSFHWRSDIGCHPWRTVTHHPSVTA